MLGETYPRIEKSIFVVTYGRSGSTLIQNMLNALPGYLVRGENANMLGDFVRAWHVLRHSEQAANMRHAAMLRGGTPSGPHQPWFGYEGIDADRLGRELTALFLRNVLRPEPDTRAIGFKEIRWHEAPDLFVPMLEFLHLYMPGKVLLIFNTRDHEDVIRSGWWKKLPEAEALGELKQAETMFAAWQDAHPEGWLAMHYDRYSDNPEAWRPLFEFLELPFDPDIVRTVLDYKLMHMKN